MESDNFDPDDLQEMSELLAHIYSDSQHGYVLEFTISRLAARDLVRTWQRARTGDENAIQNCLSEYNRIMGELECALVSDDDDTNND